MDRGRVFGMATVGERAAPRTVFVSGRRFEFVCPIDVEGLTPPRQGVEIAGLVDKLDALKTEEIGAWHSVAPFSA